MIQRILFVCVALMAAGVAHASDQRAAHPHVFSGGMIFHIGVARAENTYGDMRGVIGGLGGRLHLEALPLLRLGFTGGASSVVYDDHGSYLAVSYWGPLFEISHQVGRMRPSVGLFAGRGSVDNLHIIDQNPDKTQTADFRQGSTWMYAPVLTLEVFVTERLALALMLDHLFGSGIGISSRYGPRGFVGLLFYR